jgi:hypothetical protein
MPAADYVAMCAYYHVKDTLEKLQADTDAARR